MLLPEVTALGRPAVVTVLLVPSLGSPLSPCVLYALLTVTLHPLGKLPPPVFPVSLAAYHVSAVHFVLFWDTLTNPRCRPSNRSNPLSGTLWQVLPQPHRLPGVALRPGVRHERRHTEVLPERSLVQDGLLCSILLLLSVLVRGSSTPPHPVNRVCVSSSFSCHPLSDYTLVLSSSHLTTWCV